MRNLISLSVLDKCGYIFHFDNGEIIVYYNSIMVGSGIPCDGLYMLKVDYMSVNSTNSIVNIIVRNKHTRVDENSSMLWHRCLGHFQA